MKNIDNMTHDELKEFVAKIQRICSKTYVSLELGGIFADGHPIAVKRGVQNGIIRISDTKYKRKVPVNVWDCLTL